MLRVYISTCVVTGFRVLQVPRTHIFNELVKSSKQRHTTGSETPHLLQIEKNIFSWDWESFK